jgi:hypothetical protein
MLVLRVQAAEAKRAQPSAKKGLGGKRGRFLLGDPLVAECLESRFVLYSRCSCTPTLNGADDTTQNTAQYQILSVSNGGHSTAWVISDVEVLIPNLTPYYTFDRVLLGAFVPLSAQPAQLPTIARP